ncbi:MAG TPA: DMT family transporter [Methylomirabilota bacterium]|jgi:drug/metabolite transporter (DMT)-like permease|nr:DMT family transporter [Methylomirabilota bacterium]
MTHARAYGLLLLVTVIWAGNFPLGKLGLGELGPLTLTAARALIAAPLLLGAARLSRGALPALTRRDYRIFTVISLTGLVGNTTVWYWGLKYTSPVAAGILGASAPVVVALVAAAWLRDRLSPLNILGIVITLLAVVLTIARGSFEALRTLSFNKGDLIILGSQVAWVSYTLYGRANTSALPTVTLQAGAHVVSALVLVPLALFERPWESLARASWLGWGVILYSAGPITLGHLWYYQGIRAVGAGRAAVFMNLIPFLVIGLSWLLLGEPVRWYHAVGACAVIAGVVLATRR